MHYEMELMYTFGTIALKFIFIIFSFTNQLWCGNLVLVVISITANSLSLSKIAGNKHGRYKEG